LFTYYYYLDFPIENFFYCTFFSILAQQKSFSILSMDDFHNTNAVKTPTERTLTNALHVATPLLNIQPSVDGGER